VHVGLQESGYIMENKQAVEVGSYSFQLINRDGNIYERLIPTIVYMVGAEYWAVDAGDSAYPVGNPKARGPVSVLERSKVRSWDDVMGIKNYRIYTRRRDVKDIPSIRDVPFKGTFREVKAKCQDMLAQLEGTDWRVSAATDNDWAYCTYK